MNITGLDGLDLLWRIACENPKKRVVDNAVGFLLLLYSQVCGSHKATAPRKFIDRCMQQLQQQSSSHLDASVAAVRRTLYILRHFVTNGQLLDVALPINSPAGMQLFDDVCIVGCVACAVFARILRLAVHYCSLDSG